MNRSTSFSIKGNVPGAIVICLALPFLMGQLGCPPGGGLSPDGTGVVGLDTPVQIISTPAVAQAIRDTESVTGVRLTLSQEVNPPDIQGRYAISGSQFIPFEGPLSPGDFRWSNQTSDNHINTDFTQFLGAGIESSVFSSVGEIIRGSGNRFTVYSIVEGSISFPGVGTCRYQNIIIFDGFIDSNGDVDAIYVGSMTANHTPTICTVAGASGLINLERTGSAKDEFNDSEPKIQDGFVLGAMPECIE